MKTPLVLSLALAASSVAAPQRTVFLELFTATW